MEKNLFFSQWVACEDHQGSMYQTYRRILASHGFQTIIFNYIISPLISLSRNSSHWIMIPANRRIISPQWELRSCNICWKKEAKENTELPGFKEWAAKLDWWLPNSKVQDTSSRGLSIQLTLNVILSYWLPHGNTMMRNKNISGPVSFPSSPYTE